jgi:hypothetical protein
MKMSVISGGLAVLLGCALVAPVRGQAASPGNASVEQWGMYDLALQGPSDGNPFTDVQLSARFVNGNNSVEVAGFYDGGGTYRVHFMPGAQGQWSYQTTSNRPELSGKTGTFTVTKPTGNNHGPVHVARTFHFDYADGTPYFEIGTTAYGWATELDATEEQTLASLKDSPFNKIRMSLLPTHFPTKRAVYPYVGTPPAESPATRSAAVDTSAGTTFEVAAPPAPAPGAAPGRGRGRGRGGRGGGGGGGGRAAVQVPMPTWDYTRFNPEYFQHFEKRIAELRDLGVQADLILYTPYEYGTGFNGANVQGKGLDHQGDQRYLKYLVARFAAYRNVWWSMANEYDLMAKNTPEKRGDDYWDILCQTVSDSDPYHHLTGIHFSQHIYSGNVKPWITHISIQNGSATEDFGRALLYRDVYYKPIVFDEMNYEGKGTARWGQLSGEEMTAQFWHAWIDGTYAGHGEVLSGWSGSGGVLKGESPARLAFLQKVMQDGPATGINPIDKWRDSHIAGKGGEYYIVYFGKETPTEWPFHLPNREGVQIGQTFKVDVLDTWNMTVTPVPGEFTAVAGPTRYNLLAKDDAKITLPGKPYLALRIKASGTSPADTPRRGAAPRPPADGE